MQQLNYNSNTASQGNLMKSKSMAQIKTGTENPSFNSGVPSGRANHNVLRGERGKATRPPPVIHSFKNTTHDSQDYGNDDFKQNIYVPSPPTSTSLNNRTNQANGFQYSPQNYDVISRQQHLNTNQSQNKIKKSNLNSGAQKKYENPKYQAELENYRGIVSYDNLPVAN